MKDPLYNKRLDRTISREEFPKKLHQELIKVYYFHHDPVNCTYKGLKTEKNQK